MAPGRVLLLCVLAYVAYGALVFFFQRMLLFPGPRERARFANPPTKHEGIEAAWLTTSVGKVEVWYWRSPAASAETPAPALLFAHGNFEFIDDWPYSLPEVQRLGASVLLVEYPGYGRSEGRPTQATITETMIAAYDWLAARPEVDAERILLLGRSLGGGAACTLIGTREPAALILQSTFTSVRPFAVARGLPPFLALDPFDNESAVSRFEGPILISHGSSDTLIPYAHGKALAKLARRGKFLSYDTGHNDTPSDWPVYWDTLRAFLEAQGLSLAPRPAQK